MEPREELNKSRAGSPHSEDSSSDSDLSSSSYNRDSDLESNKRDVVEAEPSRENILSMAPIVGTFENESDSKSIVTTRHILSSSEEAENYDELNQVNRKLTFVAVFFRFR